MVAQYYKAIPWWRVVLLSLVLFAAGGWFYLDQRNQVIRNIQDSLATIGEVKANQIEDYLAGWRVHAIGQTYNSMVARQFYDVEFNRKPLSEQDTIKLHERIMGWQQQYAMVNVVLFDLRLNPLVATRPDIKLMPHLQSLHSEVDRSQKPEISDLYRVAPDANVIGLDILTPFVFKSGAGDKITGYALFTIDATRDLYPKLQWNTRIKSAEFLLVRRELNNVIYLNRLKRAKTTLLEYHRPLDTPNLAAAMALHGVTANTDAIGYLGTPVIFDARKVRGTRWYLITEADRNELLAGVHKVLWITTGLMLAFVGSIGWLALTLVAKSRAESKSGELAARLAYNEAMAKKEQQLQLFLKYNPVAVAMFDRDMRYLYASKHWFADYAISEQDIVGKSHYDLFPNLPERWKETHQRCLAGAVERCDEDPIKQADGSIEWFRWEIHPWYDLDGAIGGIIIYSEIITARKQLEEELRQHRTHLEEEVAARTSELIATNWELEEISYSTAHNLRTPLRAIDGFARILLEDYQGKLDVEGQRLLKVVRDNAQKMGLLIDDLLAFTHAGHKAMLVSEVDMEAVVRDVYEKLLPHDTGRDIRLQLDPLPRVWGDATLLRQVIANLLSNALKFTSGRTEALIEVGGNAGPEENVYFVKDNGAGFDMQYADKLFGVFQRLHGNEEFEGSGIGLAIVKRVIERHGGRVWAEGAVGEGATFWFALPQRKGG